MLNPGLVQRKFRYSKAPSVAGQPKTDLPTTAKLKVPPVPYREGKSIDIGTPLTLHGGIAVVFQVVAYGKIEEQQV